MGAASLTPEQSRAQDKAFVTGCSLAGLRERLPLSWPTPLGTPPSPKRRYRSHYVYLGWQDLEDPRVWEHLSEFDLLLRLVGLGGLRAGGGATFGRETRGGGGPRGPP